MSIKVLFCYSWSEGGQMKRQKVSSSRLYCARCIFIVQPVATPPLICTYCSFYIMQPKSLYAAESDTWEHHHSSKGNTKLCWNRQRSHSLRFKGRLCQVWANASGFMSSQRMFMKSTPSMQVPRRRQQLKALNLISSWDYIADVNFHP